MPGSRGHNPPNEEDGAAWRALIRVHGQIRQLGETHFARYGLSSAQWGVLRALSRRESENRGDPLMSELSGELIVKPPSLSATIDRMVRAGLVTRQGAAEDLRTRRIGLTNAGRTRLAEAMPDHRMWVNRMLAIFGAEERQQLRGLLERLGDHLAGELGDGTVEGRDGRSST